MRSYRPGAVPNDPAQLPGFLRLELARIAQAAQMAQPFYLLDVLSAAPDKLIDGMVVRADGTNWDPGSGAGDYMWDESSSSWFYLG